MQQVPFTYGIMLAKKQILLNKINYYWKIVFYVWILIISFSVLKMWQHKYLLGIKCKTIILL